MPEAPCLKKEKSLLIRVEEDVWAFYREQARTRRITVAQVVRELLYADMAAKTAAQRKE